MTTTADTMTLAIQQQQAGNLVQAEALYRQVLTAEPHNLNARYRLAVICQLQGRAVEAVVHYQQLLQSQPTSAKVQNNLGLAYSSLGQLAEALVCCREAVRLMPDCAEFLNNLAAVHKSRGEANEAGECYLRALRLRPDDAEAFYQLVRLCVARPPWVDEAVACLQASLPHQGDNARSYGALGDLFYCWLNRPADALPCYQRYLTLCPNDAKAPLLVEVLSGNSRMSRVPLEYLKGLYDEHVALFEQRVQRRGDCSPQLLRAALEPPPAARSLDVLDIGCGTGLCGVEFRDWAKTLVGVDLAPSMLARTRERGIYDELILSDALPAVEARPGTFDLVVASDVMLYFGDLLPITQAVREALRPGGRFGFTIDVLDMPDDYRLMPWVHFAHSRSYLRTVTAEAGMEEVCACEVTFPREGGEQAPGLVVVLRRPHS
jgi:predicted TPR repeat methyltransferase